MSRVRAVLVAALIAVAIVPIAGAQADRGGGQGHGNKHFKALIFSKTAAFRHTECIPTGTVAIAQMAQRNGFEVDATEDAGAFTEANLAQYDVVIFLCTTGDVLSGTSRRRSSATSGPAAATPASTPRPTPSTTGPGTAGSSARTSATTRAAGVNQQFQPATINVEDRKSEATSACRARWTREEEWYNFRTNPRADVHVLVSVDERPTTRAATAVPGGSPPMGDHPIAWCHRYDGGRAFYTALGHKGAYWKEPLLLAHVLGGIKMAAGAAKFNCPAGR